MWRDATRTGQVERLLKGPEAAAITAARLVRMKDCQPVTGATIAPLGRPPGSALAPAIISWK